MRKSDFLKGLFGIALLFNLMLITLMSKEDKGPIRKNHLTNKTKPYAREGLTPHLKKAHVRGPLSLGERRNTINSHVIGENVQKEMNDFRHVQRDPSQINDTSRTTVQPEKISIEKYTDQLILKKKIRLARLGLDTEE